MSDIFPKWSNRLPILILVAVGTLVVLVVAGLWYYFTPEYTRVGYEPTQPIEYSHDLHVNQLGLDCRYCHDGVEESEHANIPAAATCMNCHNQIRSESPKLELVRESHETGEPIPWVKVHKLPEFVFFNHAVHVNRGVSCVECHGRIDEMEKVRHDKPLHMGFCLQCHRNPEKYLRHPDDVYHLDLEIPPEVQEVQGEEFVQDWKVQPTDNCTACHR